MPLFDAVCTALGTAGTGGFGIKNDGLAGYSPYIQNVTTIFMLLFGVNFGCFYLLLMKRVKDVLKDEELRLYLGICAVATALIVWDLRGVYGSLGETIRHAAFQVSSIITTTGYATADFNLWPNFSKAILMTLLVLGGCAGSTAGGFKLSRAMLLAKNARRSVRRVVRPQKVQAVRCNGRAVSEKVLENINAYLAVYVLVIVISFLLISLDGFSYATSFTSVLTCVNNVGPGLEVVGPAGNFSQFSVFSKLILTLDMLVGRLEIFPMLILFSRSTWRRK